MDNLSLQPDRVGAEYRGKARIFRSKVLADAEAATAGMKAISTAAVMNVRRKYSGTRVDRALDATEAKWRALPAGEQLSLSIKRTPVSIEIADVRMTATNVQYLPEVGPIHELSICIAIASLLIKPKACLWSTIPIATVSLHAVARNLQRQANADDATLMRDLQILAIAAVDGRDRTGPFSIPAGEGAWRGVSDKLREPDGKLWPALHVRTFTA